MMAGCRKLETFLIRGKIAMKIAVTGGTGFLGRYIVRQLAAEGHELRCWHRAQSDRGGFQPHEKAIEWVEASLADEKAAAPLVEGCDAVVHAALVLPGEGFRVTSEDLVNFAQDNILGTLRLIEAARRAGAGRFVFISSCAVHDEILNDRPLDETHPTWAKSHYGAHKGAIEQFVHSYGLGEGYPICALRPCGIYGVARPVEKSKWFDLVSRVARGEDVTADRGGKEVHAGDVAKAASLLLGADEEKISGQAFNCCDRYIADYDVAQLAQELSGAKGTIAGERTRPRHEIDTRKLGALGMEFGGEKLLRATIGEMVGVGGG